MKNKLISHPYSLSAMVFFLAIVIAISVHFLTPEAQSSEAQTLEVQTPEVLKEIVYGHADWKIYEFDEFVQAADRIVYGKVVGYDDLMIIDNEKNGVVYSTRVFTPVIVEVLEWIKGGEPTETVTFYQAGGETETRIYIDSDTDPLLMGEYVLLFLNEHGGKITPRTVNKVIDGKMAAPNGVFMGADLQERADTLRDNGFSSVDSIMTNTDKEASIADDKIDIDVFIDIIKNTMETD